MKNLNCTVETPKYSNAKYNYDPHCGGFVLAKYLPVGFVFPYDFGFIPGTQGEDGDPLDVVVISEQGTFPGCILSCRIIGAIKAVQQDDAGNEIENDRFLVVPDASKILENVQRVVQLPEKLLEELQHFFVSYNKLEGRHFQLKKILSAKDAIKAIEAARNNGTPTNKIEIFVPLRDSEGQPFPAYLYKNIKRQLTKDFGGMTAYTRTPAEGIWADGSKQQIKDELVIYEVMVSEIDCLYWTAYKHKLEQQFGQKELVIRQSPMGLIK